MENQNKSCCIHNQSFEFEHIGADHVMPIIKLSIISNIFSKNRAILLFDCNKKDNTKFPPHSVHCAIVCCLMARS